MCRRTPRGTLTLVIQLAIIDGSRIFADALAARLGLEPDIRVLRCATGSAALRNAVSHSSVDVVLADAALFDAEDAERPASARRAPAAGRGAGPAAETGRGPVDPALVLLADQGDRSGLAGAVRRGVRGWVPRDATVDDLIVAIREAADGGTWIPPKILTAVLGELTWTPPADDPTLSLLATLTPRERDVLSCLADGLGRAEAAARLQVSTNTVRTHVQSILSKLGVNSCVAAVAVMRTTTAGAPPRRLLT
jgi:DNA-binding NarL/FixJ family response regulator